MPFDWLAAATIGSAALGFLGQGQTNAVAAGNAKATNAFNARQAALNRQFQSAETVKARDWSEEMSNSTYQRGVADMKAAGLNPMLAYSQGGASTPSTAAPSGSSAQGVTPSFTSPFSTLLSSAGSLASLDLASSQSEKTRAEARLLESKIPYADEHEQLSVVMHRVEQQIQSYSHEVQKYMYRGGRDMWGNDIGDKAPLQVQKFQAEIKDILQEVRTSKSREDLNRSVEKLNGLEVPKGMAFSDYYKSPAGRSSPYLDQAGRLINSAVDAVSTARGRRSDSRSSWGKDGGWSSSRSRDGIFD